MPSQNYKPKHIERAHWWMAKALDTLAEADALIPSGQTRLGAINRLYYTTHHVAVALLRLVGRSNVRKHSTIKGQFGKEWVVDRGFPKLYGRLLNHLHDERGKADYGEFVPTFQDELEKTRRKVYRFIKRAWREIPPVSTAHILKMLVDENPEIRDFSFDVYCPKSYSHHTRLTAWAPKGRVSDAWLGRLLSSSQKLLISLNVTESRDYVLGFNSRVNQYEEQHLLMLDFDNVSTIPYDSLSGEPGFFFRTESGFHFIGSVLYRYSEWSKKMRNCAKLASKQHCDLSLKRRYGTLRLTASPRKPIKPAYIGRSRP